MKEISGNISLWRKNTDFKISEYKHRDFSNISSVGGGNYQNTMAFRVLWEQLGE